jgi:hypothetical protein
MTMISSEFSLIAVRAPLLVPVVVVFGGMIQRGGVGRSRGMGGLGCGIGVCAEVSVLASLAVFRVRTQVSVY